MDTQGIFKPGVRSGLDVFILLIKETLLCFILLCVASPLYSQEVQQEYRTMRGHMIITGQVGDSTLMMKSDRLVIALNYETAELTIALAKETIKAGFDTIRQTFSTDNTSEILFKGRLGIDYVITQKHPPLDFEVEGDVYNGDEKRFITGRGHLEHIHADEYACVLNMTFEIDPELLGIEWPGTDPVRVRIMQTVLKKEND